MLNAAGSIASLRRFARGQAARGRAPPPRCNSRLIGELESGRGGAVTRNAITINGKAYGVDRGGQHGAEYASGDFRTYGMFTHKLYNDVYYVRALETETMILCVVRHTDAFSGVAPGPQVRQISLNAATPGSHLNSCHPRSVNAYDGSLQLIRSARVPSSSFNAVGLDFLPRMAWSLRVASLVAPAGDALGSTRSGMRSAPSSWCPPASGGWRSMLHGRWWRRIRRGSPLPAS